MKRFTRDIIVAGGTTLATALLTAGLTVPAGTALAAGTVRTANTVRTADTAISGPEYAPPKRTLREGMKGSDVKALQRRLNALKYYSGPASGTFGADTIEAVWAFQEVQGIGASGNVGPVTKRALVHPRAYAPHNRKGGATRVEVNLAKRVLVLYRNHSVNLISHISSGGGYRFCDSDSCAYATTPTGSYRTTGYLHGWVKVPLGAMYNPVFFIGTVYAIHGDTEVPLAPVSHGCIRIPMDVAAFFHTRLPTRGTPVYVFW